MVHKTSNTRHSERWMWEGGASEESPLALDEFLLRRFRIRRGILRLITIANSPLRMTVLKGVVNHEDGICLYIKPLDK